MVLLGEPFEVLALEQEIFANGSRHCHLDGGAWC
jgi:hypothetical protein